MLEVSNLVKDFKTGFFGRKVRVLHGVNFKVERGEIFGFIGPNGAGKTVTFKSILGFISTTSGEIKIDNIPTQNVEVKSKFGYLPESPYFYDHLTGEELIRYMGRLHGMEKEFLEKKIDKLLIKVSMDHARKEKLRKYSKGMLQRIGIAQSLINDPEFLVLDEPMSGLDPIGRKEIRDLILDQKARGKTVLLSSHILSDVESLCDRVGLILNGVVVRIGVLADLLNDIETDYEMFLNTKLDVSTIKQKVNAERVKVDKRAGFIVMRFDEAQKNELISSLLKESIDIVSIHPLRKSLQGLFAKEQKAN